MRKFSPSAVTVGLLNLNAKLATPAPRLARSSTTSLPTLPIALSERIFGGRDPDTALDTPSKVRCALTRLAFLVADGVLDVKRNNAICFDIAAAAKQYEIELAERLANEAAQLRAQRLLSGTPSDDVVDAEVITS